jgi:hypothetical protein
VDADHVNEESLFSATQELSDPKERAVFLDAACEGNRKLRRRMDALLAMQASADSFFDSGPPERPLLLRTPGYHPASRTHSAGNEAIGSRIGRYKLLQQIGEGGCGIDSMRGQTDRE